MVVDREMIGAHCPADVKLHDRALREIEKIRKTVRAQSDLINDDKDIDHQAIMRHVKSIGRTRNTITIKLADGVGIMCMLSYNPVTPILDILCEYEVSKGESWALIDVNGDKSLPLHTDPVFTFAEYVAGDWLEKFDKLLPGIFPGVNI